jgi:hypothetical protein
MRRGPEAFAAMAPPMVGSPLPTSWPSARSSAEGSKASSWPLSASSFSISESGVPAFAESTSSFGS